MLKLNIQLFAEGGTLVIGTSLDTKTFDKEIALLESKLNDIEASLQMASEDKTLFSTSEIKEMSAEAEKLRNKLLDLKKKQATVNSIDFSKAEAQLKNIGNSLNSTIKKVAKWGLALIGIRSIYSGIRRAVSLVSSENEGIASQIDVMRSAIANALLPLAQSILNIIAKIMVYINYIYKFITGKNLFDFDKAFESVSKNAQKTAGGLNSANKSAKELRKTLAGFDEMNILNDNVTSSGGAGGGVSNIGNVELTNPFENWKNFKIPNWIKKIAKLVKTAADNWEDFAGMVTLAGTALGIITGNPALAIASFIGYLITELPRLSNAIKIVTGSNSLLEAGLKTLFAVFVPYIGIPLILVDALDDLTTSTGNTASATNRLKDAQKALKDAQSKLTTAIDTYKNALETANQAQKDLKQAEKETKISGEELYKSVQNGKTTYWEMTEQQKKVFEAYLKNEQAQKNLKTATDNVTKATENEKKAVDEERVATVNDALAKLRAQKDYEGYKKTVVDAYNSGKIKAGEARDFIEQACQDMSDASAKTFTKDLPSDIKTGLNPNKYKTAMSELKRWFNDFFDWIKTGFNNIKNKITSAGGGVSSGGGRKGAKGLMYYSSNIPKLAVGGIINKPGSGIPYRNSIIGERGAEAVLPLTDSQQMALLGEAIGRYITVNANIVNTMNGRVISKELQKVQNESDFAFNR